MLSNSSGFNSRSFLTLKPYNLNKGEDWENIQKIIVCYFFPAHLVGHSLAKKKKKKLTRNSLNGYVLTAGGVQEME